MKSDNLLNAIGNISDKYIEETTSKKVVIKTKIRILWIAVAAACFIVAVALSTISPNILNNPENTDNITYYSSDNLQKISCSFDSAGMGGAGNSGHIIVKELYETTSKNPTLNNVENITELPVFANEEDLWSESHSDLDSIDDLIYFKNSVVETTYSYNFDGVMTTTWNVCYQYNSKKSLIDQLLDYSFHRIFYTRMYHDNHNGDIGWARVMNPPSNPGILYPVISLSEAEEKLRNGDFFSYGDEKTVAKTANILSVEIVYLVDPNTCKYQSYLQPFYMFYITDAGWDLSFMECENKDEFTSVSPVYIPALQDRFLEITEPNIFFN